MRTRLGKMGKWLKQGQKIRTKMFVLYFSIIFFTIMGMGFSAYYLSYDHMQTQAETYNTEMINQMEKNLEQNFQQIRHAMLMPYNATDDFTADY